jgi:hypothetical protein
VESVARLPLKVKRALAVSLAVEKTSLEDAQPENIEKVPLENEESENVEKRSLEMLWRHWSCNGLPRSY